ncbi:hypothetical protein FJT64_003342 [Amphibalanus amphitrite]|uniref:Uncharacterized protein n=1 Tax=Amphibalanus amphitrite TaxID=1232801 RepID=A0A6A4W295_AMPAM|nr:hypothetical protein FJT64_003342 [Amphibalanus amphitrite]
MFRCASDLSSLCPQVRGASDHVPADLVVSAPAARWAGRLTGWALVSAVLGYLAARRWPQLGARLLASLSAKRVGSAVTLV